MAPSQWRRRLHWGPGSSLLRDAYGGGALQEQRYNPELQKRSLANREQKQQDFDNFVVKLKEYSKSKKTSTVASIACIIKNLLIRLVVWDAAADAEAATKARALEEQQNLAASAKARSNEIRKEAISGK
ncbi:MAG: hypothetical protein LQ340_004778 [Diploschistes diacapsis]|nr:MAG: hypothetical protein LQ340_004778 [Diploschistes diacapsis]